MSEREPARSESDAPKRDDSEWDLLERSESELWRNALWLIAGLAVWGAATSWEHLRGFSFDLRGIPGGVLLLVGLFAAYTWGRRREIIALRTFVRRLARGSEGEVQQRDQ